MYEEDPEASVAAIPSHDVLDMTQPSQHVSQPPIPIPTATASSSRPAKLPTRRMKGEKWSITKDLDVQKRNKIYEDWGWGIGQKPKLQGPLKVCGIHISENAMQSLAPSAWVDDRIIYCYMVLMLDLVLNSAHISICPSSCNHIYVFIFRDCYGSERKVFTPPIYGRGNQVTISWILTSLFLGGST